MSNFIDTGVVHRMSMMEFLTYEEKMQRSFKKEIG